MLTCAILDTSYGKGCEEREKNLLGNQHYASLQVQQGYLLER